MGAIGVQKFHVKSGVSGVDARYVPRLRSLVDVFVLLLHCAAKLLHVRVSLVSPAEQKQRNADLSDLRRCSVFRRIEAIPGVQTEALWTHLDPSKPEEQRIMPLACPDARAVGCHADTSRAVTIAL